MQHSFYTVIRFEFLTSPVFVLSPLLHGSLLQLWVCSILPSHSRPPFLGGGAEQVLFLCLSPPPHWASHADQSVHSDQRPSTAWENANEAEITVQPQNLGFWNIHKTTWTRSRKTCSAVKLSSTTGTARHSFPQNVSLSEQRTQTTWNAARTPCRPGGHDAVHCRKRRDMVEIYRLCWFTLCNVFTEHTLQILPQSFSSDPSTQSLWRSHLWSRWTHSPLAQENCLPEQGLGICGVTAGLLVPEKKRTH